jgi:hypothetical protein
MMGIDSMSPCVGPQRKPSISQARVLIEETVMVVGYTVGCYELLVYCRQCSISGSSLLIMLTVVLVLVFSHCIGYYDNQIDKLNMVIG